MKHPKINRIKKRIITLAKVIRKGGFDLCLLPFLFLVYANHTIEIQAQNKIYQTIENIPSKQVGLLLGTGKYLKNGYLNPYFIYRVQAAVQLYKAGKIKFILISGDNHSADYDEPTDFKNELITQGVPEDCIVLDYAGFRTLDSVVRAKEVFGLKEFTIISQGFHNERALYLAQSKGVNAIAFNARDLPKELSVKVKFREFLARGKVFIDLITFKKPKFLGPKIKITAAIKQIVKKESVTT